MRGRAINVGFYFLSPDEVHIIHTHNIIYKSIAVDRIVELNSSRINVTMYLYNIMYARTGHMALSWCNRRLLHHAGPFISVSVLVLLLLFRLLYTYYCIIIVLDLVVETLSSLAIVRY